MSIAIIPKRQSIYYRKRVEHGQYVMSRRLREGMAIRIRATGTIGVIAQMDVCGQLLTVRMPDVKRNRAKYEYYLPEEVERLLNINQ